jgi:GAF domain-containing protein
MQVVDTLGPDALPYARAHARTWNFRSNARAPLVREGKVIGAVSVQSSEPGALTDKQMALLGTFADQAVIAIENVRLFKELQQRIGQMTALSEVGRAVSSTLDLEQVLQTIVQHAVKLMGLDGGSIYEYDEARGRFSLQAAENIEPELVTAVRERPVKRARARSAAARRRSGRSRSPISPIKAIRESASTSWSAPATGRSSPFRSCARTTCSARCRCSAKRRGRSRRRWSSC